MTTLAHELLALSTLLRAAIERRSGSETRVRVVLDPVVYEICRQEISDAVDQGAAKLTTALPPQPTAHGNWFEMAGVRFEPGDVERR